MPNQTEHFPLNAREFETWFKTYDDCRNYLNEIRWGDSFVCPKCRSTRFALMTNGYHLCLDCKHKCSATSGTIFEKTHISLLAWFRAIWYVCSQKDGASALGLQRVLALGSYKTAWLILHKIRKAMVTPERSRLSGLVQVDESYIGGSSHGIEKKGRGTEQSLIFIAIEKQERKLGRCRIVLIPNASAMSLNAAIAENIEPGSTLETDGWRGYNQVEQNGYIRKTVRKEDMLSSPENLLPQCHLISSLLQRWLLSTLQGAVRKQYLQDYLNEYIFRFNRRKSGSRGKLFFRLIQNAVRIERSTLREIIDNH